MPYPPQNSTMTCVFALRANGCTGVHPYVGYPARQTLPSSQSARVIRLGTLEVHGVIGSAKRVTFLHGKQYAKVWRNLGFRAGARKGGSRTAPTWITFLVMFIVQARALVIIARKRFASYQ